MIDLLCLGDSLTFGPGVRNSQKWTSLAAGETLRITNLGVPGDTTAGMLARLQAILQSEKRPTVLVMGGSNDIFFSGSATAARGNLAAMVHQLSAAGFQPVVGIPLPICVEDAPQKWAKLADFARSAALLEEYCRWLRVFCETFGIPVVDFHNDYVNQDGSVRREIVTIVDKHEYRKLMDYVHKADPKAFVTVYSVNEVRYQPKK